ncbi:hypothetical protein ONZ45_g12602 [Pleurotus djamor]|nr:hypothetical protein ONZ45_g12602 [Pleurotus djamor]
MTFPFLPIRLFNTRTRSFTTDVAYKQYAILSHRWDGENELTYNQLLNYSSCLTSSQKFEKFCEVASTKYECQYVWMDSACINRDDAIELENSIRSMYWWYKNAEVCIVYLADAFDNESFASSSWFTRGWTLQELLAPQRMAFYYRDWTRLSQLDFDLVRDRQWWILYKKSNDCAEERKFLRQRIAEAAGLDGILLDSTYTPSTLYLEGVLKWGKVRCTSRPEDAAYSLVSLLDVCLPPHYGEGKDRALDRLRDACRRDRKPKTYTLTRFILPVHFILLQNPSKSQFCERHQGLQGQPKMLHTKEYDSFLTCILFTSLPLSTSPGDIRHFSSVEDIDGAQQGYISHVRLSSFALRGVINPKTFETDPYLCNRGREIPFQPLMY